MNTTRITRGFTVTLVVCMVAAVNAACSYSGCGLGGLCGPGNPGSYPSAPPTVYSSTTIASNDTEPVNAGGTQWDITQVKTERKGFAPGGPYTQIDVFVTFAQSTAFSALPTPGSAPTGGAALGVLIYFDTDSNIATGITPTFCASAYKGMEYAVSDGSTGGRLSNGNYDIINLSTLTKSGEATVNGGGSTIAYSIPLSAIGGGTSGLSGLMGVAASNFMGGENVVDCAPDGATVST